jgi:hypothetical protein
MTLVYRSADFDPEDGDVAFLRNVGSYINYPVIYSGRLQLSNLQFYPVTISTT